MPLNVDLSAIAVMEVLGVVAFFEAFLFFRQFRRMRNKQREFLDALKRGAVSNRADGKCFSSDWVIGNIVYKPKRLLNATPLLAMVFGLAMAVLSFMVIPTVLANTIGLGYAFLIALVGVAILLWTDAFEAYGYSNALHDMAAEQLDREDQSYIELAETALEKASQRFFSLAVAFALLGPFIPQIFNGVEYALIMYLTVFFQASDASLRVFAGFGVLIVLFLPLFMLLLPEFVAPMIIRKGRMLARRLVRFRVKK